MNIKRRINVLSIFLVLFLSFFTASNISADSSLNIIELETDTDVLKLNTASGENMSLEEQSNLEAAEKAYSNLFNSFFLNFSKDRIQLDRRHTQGSDQLQVSFFKSSEYYERAWTYI